MHFHQVNYYKCRKETINHVSTMVQVKVMEEMFVVEDLQNSVEFAKVNLYKFSTFNAKLHAKEYSHPMEIG